MSSPGAAVVGEQVVDERLPARVDRILAGRVDDDVGLVGEADPGGPPGAHEGEDGEGVGRGVGHRAVLLWVDGNEQSIGIVTSPCQ